MSTNITHYDYCRETLELKKNIESAFLHLAERLYRIKNEELWTSNWSSWSEYLMELDVTDSTCSKLIKIYEFYVLKHGVNEDMLRGKSWSTLYEALPLVESQPDPMPMIEKLSVLSRNDQRELLREHKHGPCDHPWEEILMRRCPNCGKLERVLP